MGRYAKVLAGALLFAVVAFGTAVEIRHWYTFGHVAPLTLHADVTVFPWDIAIPGITKGYEAHLTNYGLMPRRVERCAYLTDAFQRGESIGYKLQLWNEQTNKWDAMLDASSVYCQPAPLSMVEANKHTNWLWPGQSLSTREEATGARGNLKGKSLRFIVVANGRDYPTASFVIDEQLQESGTPYRVAH